eukprot:CAMPEP_0197174104 /NCGR_PEP_ID=MMETSP1423-20130617/773_1 /TAXON_ID=476441 /ORGANISM="Pseudo-nitzschia heimii, Strain UNC1101" /LENGTH=796 /DNA_ID=CAMNT_0042623001 /DNA_START=115 /DNA_END=2505 /DNA_ORIENTATION=+
MSGVVVDAARPFSSTAFLPKTRSGAALSRIHSVLQMRGGEDATVTAESEAASGQEKSLDEKVSAAMEKLGLTAPSVDDDNAAPELDCKDGVCVIPGEKNLTNDQQTTTNSENSGADDPIEIADRLAKEMGVDFHMAIAAIGVTSTGEGDQRTFDESAARAMLQQELDFIETIPEDSESVKTLTAEGFDAFMSRRALAFSENKLEDARAILLADQLDAKEEEEEEEAARAAAAAQPSFEPMDATSSIDTPFEPMAATNPVETAAETNFETVGQDSDFVEVKANFDPTKLPTSTPTASPPAAAPANSDSGSSEMPKPARKEDVVFDATTDQIQDLVLESPVPVLVDFYADWCGPCKALGPALEDMAIKSGGMFRLVKINSDNERPVSQALGVSALPTVFGVNEGKIVHMFEGMPKSEEMMRNFMMGLFGAAPFSPPVTSEQEEKYQVLTSKLIKSASAASFSFSARERLTDRIVTKMDEIVSDDAIPDVEGAAKLIRTFFNNIVNNPYEAKFRRINLENKIVASKISKYVSCLSVLRSVGFTKSGSEMLFKADQKVINIAPLVVARDTIDKWIQRNRKEMAAAARKRKDELDRAQLVFEEEEEEEEESEEVEEIDSSSCRLKLRLDGKNKIHDVILHKDDQLKKVLEELNVDIDEDEIQITCVAKRLIVKSKDQEAMEKSLSDHGLMPAANLVVKVGASIRESTSNIKERTAARKARKKGTHTMQSIGVYAKDDNNKAELIDGGGGVWYEHDISDDEDEGDEDKDKDEKEEVEEATSKQVVEQESAESEASGTSDESK